MSGWGIRTRVGGVDHYDSRTTNLGMYLGTIVTNGVNGSWTHPRLSQGQVDYQIYGVSTGGSLGQFMKLNITVSGNTLTWAYINTNGGTQLNMHIVVWIV